MRNFNQALVALNVWILLAGCYDGNDLVGTDTQPVSQPPDIHGKPKPDGGVPAAAVEQNAQAIIGPGMRSCFVSPEQTHGEVTLSKYHPWPPDGASQQCMVMQTNLQSDLCSPTLHWYDGGMMNDTVSKVGGFAFDKRCIKVQLFSEWQFGGTMTEQTACAGPGAYANLFLTPTGVSSVKTYYYACPNYPNCP